MALVTSLRGPVYFIFVFWGWTIARKYEAPIYAVVVFAAIAIAPYYGNMKKVQLFGMTACISLNFATAALSRLDPSHQVFMTFVDFTMLGDFENGAVMPMICAMAKSLTLILTPNMSKVTIAMTGLMSVSCIALRKLCDEFLFMPFTLTTSCLSAFLHVANGARVNIYSFIVSILLSIPRFPLDVEPQELTTRNIMTLLYVMVTVAANVLGIYVGVKYSSLGLVSDAIMSMCNAVALVGEVAADVASKMEPTKRFSYGFKRAKVICSFAVGILMCYVSYDLISGAVVAIVEGPEEGDEAGLVLFQVALLGLVLNLAGLFVLGTMDMSTCRCSGSGGAMAVIADLAGSVAVAFSSFLRVRFGITFIDPFVSLLISIGIFVMAIIEMVELLRILSQGLSNDVGNPEFNSSYRVVTRMWLMDDEDIVMTGTVYDSKSQLNDPIEALEAPVDHVCDMTLEKLT